jgi:hypothetical protein
VYCRGIIVRFSDLDGPQRVFLESEKPATTNVICVTFAGADLCWKCQVLSGSEMSALTNVVGQPAFFVEKLRFYQAGRLQQILSVGRCPTDIEATHWIPAFAGMTSQAATRRSARPS